ncbi:endoplasmic reticulum membrane-associated RNA degradation protein-like isoform X1 [Halichondria panicea]|uniref:endoplasmic reticulum membrane-associated RNA degradation protein-like isoform X1 n=1 Tax=Halichondria panicea TaxID=6063 RepID=UPI00312B96C7
MNEEEEVWSLAIAQSSPLIRSFWMGQYLQLVEGRQPHCDILCPMADKPCCRAEQARRAITVEMTSLSPSIHEMVVGSIARFHQSPPQDYAAFLLSDCTLNWTVVTAFLEQSVRVGNDDCAAGGRRCAELAFHVHRQLASRALYSELEKRDRFAWTHSPELFVRLVRELKSEGPLPTLITLLIGTAALERALGDVYVSVTGSTHCPLLLRDLLATEEMEQALGHTAVFILRCVIGPPTGLNLRNIVWHGFFSYSEIPPQYSVFILVLAASLGPLLSSPLSFRPHLTLTQDTPLALVFQELGPGDCVLLEGVVSHSFFVLPTMLPVWRSALEAFTGGRYAECLVLLLPSLEHGLRRVFAASNGCPHRALTAESTTLYTTFDEMLSPLLPSGEANKLISEIGANKMEMLLDVLVYSEGPRVRDRISHGEVEFGRLSRVLANHMLCLAMLFAAQYCLNKDLLRQSPLVRSLLSIEAGYVSIFHPLSMLKQELLQLLSTMNDWENIPKPEEFANLVAPHSSTSLLTALSHVRIDGPSDDWCGSVGGVRDVIECVWGRRLCTLYMERRDLELVGVARRTLENTQQAVSQIQELAALRYSQYIGKQLRSRQRPNYQHLVSSLPQYCGSVLLLMILSLACLSHLPLDSDHEPVRIIKYHKKLLQFSENAHSQSSRNRWEEVDKLCASLAQLTLAFPK